MSSLRDEILSRLDIVDLVSKYVNLKKTGKNWTGLCPFHKEKTPSFTVAEDKQIFKCFGCGKGGNAVTFHMEIERADFRESIQELAKMTGVDISTYQKDPEKTSAEKSEKEKFKLLNKRIQNIFTTAFPKSIAEQYALEKRKLSAETIKNFGLGYAPDSHYEVINALKNKGFTSDDLTKAGVAKQGQRGDVYAFFRDRLTFPIHNHLGTIVGFGARALQSDQNPKYLNTTETPLYDKSKILYGLDKAKQQIKNFNALIVVEGYMDVIALSQYGIPIGIATCGTALTQEHMKLVKRSTENVYFAFDNDNAGFEATIRGLKIAYQQEVYPRVIQLPTDYKDIDEYLTKNPTEGFEQIKTLSHDGFSFVINALKNRYDPSNPVYRKKQTEMLFDILRNIEDYSILTMFLESIATSFNSSHSVMLKQFKQFLSSKRTPEYNKQETTHESTAPSVVVGSLLYKDYLTSNGLINEQITKLLENLTTIIDLIPSDPLYTIIHDKVEESTLHEALVQQQLTREHQRGETTPFKITESLVMYFRKILHEYKRSALKNASLTAEQKQTIMKL